jgi:hypothetical protein
MTADFSRIRELTPVIAGNMRQFQDWLRDNALPGNKYRYVWEADQLRGIRPEKIYLVGTYYENPAHSSGVIAHLAENGTEVIDTWESPAPKGGPR